MDLWSFLLFSLPFTPKLDPSANPRLLVARIRSQQLLPSEHRVSIPSSRESAWNLQKSAVISRELDLTYPNHLRFMGIPLRPGWDRGAGTRLCRYIGRGLQLASNILNSRDGARRSVQGTICLWNCSDWQHLSGNFIGQLREKPTFRLLIRLSIDSYLLLFVVSFFFSSSQSIETCFDHETLDISLKLLDNHYWLIKIARRVLFCVIEHRFPFSSLNL